MFIDDMRGLNVYTILLRVLLALIVGGIIGIERGRKNQPAGFRTYMLVCLGANLVMMTRGCGRHFSDHDHFQENRGQGTLTFFGYECISQPEFPGSSNKFCGSLQNALLQSC